MNKSTLKRIERLSMGVLNANQKLLYKEAPTGRLVEILKKLEKDDEKIEVKDVETMCFNRYLSSYCKPLTERAAMTYYTPHVSTKNKHRPGYWPSWAGQPSNYSYVVEDAEYKNIINKQVIRMAKSLIRDFAEISKYDENNILKLPNKNPLHIMELEFPHFLERILNSTKTNSVLNSVICSLLFNEALCYNEDEGTVQVAPLISDLSDGLNYSSLNLTKKALHTILKKCKKPIRSSKYYDFYCLDFYTLIILSGYLSNPIDFSLNKSPEFFKGFITSISRMAGQDYLLSLVKYNGHILLIFPKTIIAKNLLHINEFEVVSGKRHTPTIFKDAADSNKKINLTNKDFFDFERFAGNTTSEAVKKDINKTRHYKNHIETFSTLDSKFVEEVVNG